MIISLILFTILMSILASVLWGKCEDDLGDIAAVTAMVSGIVLLGMLIGVGISYGEHNSDLATIRTNHKLVQIYQDKANNLRQITASANRGQVEFTANADTPVGSVIEALSKTETEIAEAKQRLYEAERSIEERKLGPFWFIVSIKGEK